MSKNLDSIHISSYIYSISYHRSLFQFFNGFFLQEIGCDSIWEILFNVQSIYGAATILFLFVIYILSFSLFSICSGAYTHLFQRKDKLYSNFHPKSGLRMSLFWNNWVPFDVSMAMNVSSVENATEIRHKSCIFCSCRRVSHRVHSLHCVEWISCNLALFCISRHRIRFYRDCKSYHFQGPAFVCSIWTRHNTHKQRVNITCQTTFQ